MNIAVLGGGGMASSFVEVTQQGMAFDLTLWGWGEKFVSTLSKSRNVA